MIKQLTSLLYSIIWPVVLLVFIWVVYLFNDAYQLHLNDYGIQPRQVIGLIGIISAPFLHGSPMHLFSNSIPLLVSGGFLFFFFPDKSFRILALIWFFSGLGVWLYGKYFSNHIGASGIVYGLVAFLLTSGIIRRNKSMAAVAFILVFLYGSMVWGLFPQWNLDPLINISWESHLSGAVTGIVLAFVYRKHGPPDDAYESDTEDEDEFDDDGAYWKLNEDPDNSEPTKIIYHFQQKNPSGDEKS